MAISKQRLMKRGLECMKIPVSPVIRRIPSPPYRRNIRLKHLGTIKNGLLNDPGIVIQTFMLNLDEMVNLHPVQFRLSLVVKVHPVESSNANGSKGLSQISSKFRVRISAGWWKNDDKGINPKVNLAIYDTWVPLMSHRCPWCNTKKSCWFNRAWNKNGTHSNDSSSPIETSPQQQRKTIPLLYTQTAAPDDWRW